VSAPLECIDCGTTTGVEPRWPGYGHKSYPRCQRHGDARLEREKGNQARNFSRAPIPETGVGAFDEADAGERFDEDD
jgi:hypothetical protein